MRTKTDAALEAAAANHEDDPERAELIHRARRFKASWVELAQALTDVKRSGRWRDWGHASLEEYAKTELHLRQETVDKLTGSYAFLKRRAPEVLQRDGVRESIPSYHAVDFLRRAEEETGAPVEVVESLRKRVLEDPTPLPSVSRKLKDAVFPPSEDDRAARDTAALKNVAMRLRELVEGTRVIPKRLAGEVGSALDKLLEAIGDKEQAA
jgi:hypothetical protein